MVYGKDGLKLFNAHKKQGLHIIYPKYSEIKTSSPINLIQKFLKPIKPLKHLINNLKF